MSAEPQPARLTPATLALAVRTAEPCAFLVLPRILRRVITQDRQLAGLALRLPHRKSYVIAREPLLALVDPDELGMPAEAPLPEWIILLPQPSEAWLAEAPASTIVRHYWRLLFHAKIHAELEARRRAGALSERIVHERIRQIGPTAFDEIRAVLGHEGFLLPPRDDLSTYIEFAAVYWELRQFAPSLLPRYFPAIEDLARLEHIVGQDLDAARLFEQTRLPGLADQLCPNPASQLTETPGPAERGTSEDGPVTAAPAESAYRRLVRRAQEAAHVGNLVRSAILRARAEQIAPLGLQAKARNALKRDVDRLVRRLQVALGIEQEDSEPWQQCLLPLARQAPRGVWTPEARLLYDLQKVCIDHEREAYEVDLLGWVFSLGRRPIRRPLPAQREVAMARHLRNAARRIPAVRLMEPLRHQLATLVETATHHAEIRLRTRFRPMVGRALDEAGLRPDNLPEKIAWDKLVEELLDRVVEHGYLTMGDLRDAISRNHVKLADFSWRADGLQGDPLLRADRRLAATLDGVHRRGEFYLRWMQRLSSLAFGTPFGRLLTRYLAVPFGGTYLVVAFVDHLIEKLTGAPPALAGSATVSTLRILILGTFLMAVLNVERFRHGMWRMVVRGCRAVREAILGLTRWLARLEWLQRLLHSRIVALGYRFVLKPLVITAAAWLALPLEAAGWQASTPFAAALFVAINLFLNSRVGRDLEELLVDWTVQAWRRLGVRILTGLFYLVVDVFRGILENVERVLYTVDEWLQFRTGETRLSFATKAVVGTGWSAITYVVRFCINLLIEPQINPIKHFPVVTVSHKLLWATAPYLAGSLQSAMADLAVRTDNPRWAIDYPAALAIVTSVIWCIPGVFGFLVWELKENWRLYAANRPQNLKPALVGPHGETVGRLLRPGFHSGTIPKLFAKVRRAERRALNGAPQRAAIKPLRALEHAEWAVRQFLQRELCALLAHCPAWQAGPVSVGPIRFATNRIRLVLVGPEGSQAPLEMAWEMRSGWLVGHVERAGWVAQLAPSDRRLFQTALEGLFRLAGVQLVRPQLDAILPDSVHWDIVADGLVGRPLDDPATEVTYDLRSDEPAPPHLVQGPLAPPLPTLPTLDPTQAVFARIPLPWSRWVAFWQDSTKQPPTVPEPILGVRLLPGPTESA